MKKIKTKNCILFSKKLSVVKSYLTSELSYQELAFQSGIVNPSIIARWVSEFRVAGPDALRPHKKGRKKTMGNSKENQPVENIQDYVLDTSPEHV
ncbi:MAG: helix-turn-helix domain-containing protein, partial [Megasphaera sp.]|nr:helix-turn-helix domain-containing protein [Megasphaera sp.]